MCKSWCSWMEAKRVVRVERRSGRRDERGYARVREEEEVGESETVVVEEDNVEGEEEVFSVC